MTIDHAAAAYGLLQVAFAEMVDWLAAAVFQLRQEKDSTLTFKATFHRGFKRNLQEFKTELQHLDRDPYPTVAEDIHDLQQACGSMTALAEWRNDRVHARVRRVDDGLALYEWRTGKRLSITHEECRQRIDGALRVVMVLRGFIGQRARRIEIDKRFDQLFRALDDDNLEEAD